MVDDFGAGGLPRRGRGAARPPAGGRAAPPRRPRTPTPRRPPAEAAGPLLHRLPGLPRPDDRRRRCVQRRRPRRGCERRRHPPHPAAELHPRRTCPEARLDERRRARSAALGFPLDVEPAARHVASPAPASRFCNFAVAETKSSCDEIVAAPGSALRRRRRRARAQPRRLPARLRPPLGRRHRPAGHDAARARRGRRASSRPTTSSCAAASAPRRRSAGRSPAGAARPRSSSYVERLFRAYLDGRASGEPPAVLPPASPTRSCRRSRPAGSADVTRWPPSRPEAETVEDATMMEIASIAIDQRDDCSTSTRPASSRSSSTTRARRRSSRWALERFGIAARHLHQLPGRGDGDPRHGLADRSRRARVHRRHRAAAAGDLRPDRAACAQRYGIEIEVYFPDAGAAGAMVARATASTSSSAVVQLRLLLLRDPQGRSAHAACSTGSTPGSPACAATSGRAAPTSARSRSTTTTAASPRSTRSPTGPSDEVWEYIARQRRARTTRSTTRATPASAARPAPAPTSAGEDPRAGPLVVGEERAEGVRHPLPRSRPAASSTSWRRCSTPGRGGRALERGGDGVSDSLAIDSVPARDPAGGAGDARRRAPRPGDAQPLGGLWRRPWTAAGAGGGSARPAGADPGDDPPDRPRPQGARRRGGAGPPPPLPPDSAGRAIPPRHRGGEPDPGDARRPDDRDAAVHPQGPGVFRLGLETDRVKLTLEIDRHGITVESLEV